MDAPSHKLCTAAKNGDLEGVKKALRQGVRVDSCDDVSTQRKNI